jgi:hypothetical protein
MSKYVMEFYDAANGVQFEIHWRDAGEFAAATAFLRDLLGKDGMPGVIEPDRTPFSWLAGDAQRDALFRFQRELRDRGRR